MSHRYQVALLVCIALLVSLGFAATRLAQNSADQLTRLENLYTQKKMDVLSSFITQPVPVVVPEAEPKKTKGVDEAADVPASGALLRAVSVPANEKVIALHQLVDEEQGGQSFVVVTQLPPDLESGPSRVRIYQTTPTETYLLKEQQMGSYFRSATFTMTSGPYVDVQLHGIGEGPFGWEEVIHVVLIPFGSQMLGGEDKDPVRSVVTYQSSFLSLLRVELHGKTYDLKLKAKNDCKKEYSDAVTGILVNDTFIPFKKSVSIHCPVFGEGEPMPTLPGLSDAKLYDEGYLVIPLPGENEALINIQNPSISSDAFVEQEYPLP